MKQFVCILFGFFLCAIAAALLLYPERYVSSCLQGILLWAECVVPSLFPFMVVSSLLISSGWVQRCAKLFTPLCKPLALPPFAPLLILISLCSGYPTGSKMVADFYERKLLSKEQAFSLACLCSTSGPLFLVGTVGLKMFQNKHFGLLLLVCHALSNLLIGLGICLYQRKKPQRTVCPVMIQTSPLEGFASAVTSLLTAGSFIVFFFVLGKVLDDFLILTPLQTLLQLFLPPQQAKGLVLGLLEATTGCLNLNRNGLPIAGFLVTFGGCSILLQQLYFLKRAQVPTIPFVIVKFCQALLCALLLALFT